jgi:hypothetical protein
MDERGYVFKKRKGQQLSSGIKDLVIPHKLSYNHLQGQTILVCYQKIIKQAFVLHVLSVKTKKLSYSNSTHQ